MECNEGFQGGQRLVELGSWTWLLCRLELVPMSGGDGCQLKADHCLTTMAFKHLLNKRTCSVPTQCGAGLRYSSTSMYLAALVGYRVAEAEVSIGVLLRYIPRIHTFQEFHDHQSQVEEVSRRKRSDLQQCQMLHTDVRVSLTKDCLLQSITSFPFPAYTSPSHHTSPASHTLPHSHNQSLPQ